MALTDLIPWRSQSPLARNEWDVFSSMQREMNRVFDEMWTGGTRPTSRGALGMFSPSVDVVEDGNTIRLRADVPGIREKDIKVTLSEDGSTLVLEGEKKHEEETTAEGFYRAERMYGRFRRVVDLPCRVDSKNLEAKYKNGVLQMNMSRLPEKEQHTHQIPVRAG